MVLLVSLVLLCLLFAGAVRLSIWLKVHGQITPTATTRSQFRPRLMWSPAQERAIMDELKATVFDDFE